MTEQAKFEAWVDKRWPNMALDKQPNGSYWSVNAERLWEAWLACLIAHWPDSAAFIDAQGNLYNEQAEPLCKS